MVYSETCNNIKNLRSIRNLHFHDVTFLFSENDQHVIVIHSIYAALSLVCEFFLLLIGVVLHHTKSYS